MSVFMEKISRKLQPKLNKKKDSITILVHGKPNSDHKNKNHNTSLRDNCI